MDTLTPGTRLGRYEVRSKIGAGGMGEVYLAQDLELDRTVAVKLLTETLASDQQRLQRFIQEAKAASALNHPHILTIYEIGMFASSRFIATEFIEGRTLRERMKAGMTLGDALEFSIQIASALSAAHAAGIVHRDIKPENVMVRHDGYVKVLDFGLAKLTAVETAPSDPEAATRAMVNTDAGTVMGTASYMSPEQAKGIPVDARSDVWSLGVVLYEMIAGVVPFKGETPTETISLVLQRDFVPLSRQVPAAPAELDRIVTKTLTKDREERYQTMKDLLIDLRNLKRKLEVDAEINRTFSATGSGAATVGAPTYATASAAAPTADTIIAHPSSAEFIFTGIKKHKLVTALAAFVLIAAVLGLVAYLRLRNAPASIDSIAVLPFENQNRDADTDYISDGVTESIINSLTQIPNVKVIARSSVFRYKGKNMDPLTVGKELGVRAVLTGRIGQRGDTLTISTELLDVRDNKQIWGEQYSQRVSDLMSVQRDIAKQISNNLQVQLSGEQKSRLDKRYTESAEAYQLYLRGRFYWNKRTLADLQKAAGFFQQAIEKDPQYALAYSGLADSYALLNVYGGGAATQLMPQAKAAAQKALALDENLAEAHASLGQIIAYYDFDLDGADREYQRALQLNPNYATAHQWRAENLSGLKRTDEALAEVKRALELDPFSLIINRVYADTLVDARRFDEAIDQYKKTIDLNPNFPSTYFFLGRAYEGKGQYREAVAEYIKSTEGAFFSPQDLDEMRKAFEKGGWRLYLQKMAEQLAKRANAGIPTAPFMLATVYARLGQKDETFNWLEKAFQQRDFRVTYIEVDFEFDSLRSDPRYADLVRRIGQSRK